MKKRCRWILIFGIAVLATACMIFAFSAQDGPSSSKTSQGFTLVLLRLLRPGFDALPAAEQQQLLNRFLIVVRKLAHFTEFALLGTFLHLLFAALRYRLKAPLAWLTGTLYAVTDEWHQMFVSQRAASWLDVGIDSVGVLIGVLAVLVFLILRKKRREKKRASAEG